MADKPVLQERTEGPTPNGGDYAVAYYQNSWGEATFKPIATHVVVAEFKGDKPFFWTHASLGEEERVDLAPADTLPKPQPL